MRQLLLSAAALAFLVMPAMAQGGGPTEFTNKPPVGNDPGGGFTAHQRGAQPAQPAQPQAAPQARGNGQDQGNRNNRGDRGTRQGQQGGNNSFDNRGYDNRGYDNRTYGNRNGGRRDFSGFRNYHRDWRTTRRFDVPSYRRPYGFSSHRWNYGEFLPRSYWERDYWLDYRIYDLPQPPRGAIWVRVADDALMIDEYSGEVITVAYNVFY